MDAAAQDGGESPRTRRGRDPEKAREDILRAAVAEFGAHGFAGARTAAIAKRAGVSSQLITHHFGGKQGVLDELRRRWLADVPGRPDVGASFADSLAAQLDAVLGRPDWARLELWQALERERPAEVRSGTAERMRATVQSIRERQERGELAADADPRFIALLAYLVVFAPLSMPEYLAELIGGDPLSADYRDWVSGQLSALLRSRGR